jgi:uncharacterized membrane protein
MEFLYLFIAVLFYVFYRALSKKIDNSTDLFQKTRNEVISLKTEIALLRNQLLDFVKPSSTFEEKAPEKLAKPVIIADVINIIQEEKEEAENIFAGVEGEDEDETDLVEETAEPVFKAQEPIKKPYVPEEPKPSFFATFLEKNPDIEKFIGENLINKIGIFILVLGIGFFVKFAIDQNWINEIGRVGIGIIAGSILIGLAHRLKSSFIAFSSVLVGGGLAIFYFTITIAFHEYNIFDQSVAFGIMVIITAFAILLSIAYNRIELAVIALIGGFSSPFMVSTGEGNYVILFSYILILNAGILTLAYFKKWSLLNILAFIFTIVLYGGWMFTLPYKKEQALLIGALSFATAFYLVFFVMNIINNLRQGARFTAFEIGVLMLNTSAYYGAGMYILSYLDHGSFQGIFTICVAIFNMIFAYVLYRNKSVDMNLVYLLIGIVLTFISLTAPVQLEGNYITLFWAIEAVLLLWFSQKSGLKQIRFSSIVILVLMLISLCMDWEKIYGGYLDAETLPVILNKGFITGLASFISLSLYIFLLTKDDGDAFGFMGLSKSILTSGLKYLTGTILYVFLLLELNYQLDIFIEIKEVSIIIVGIYNFMAILILNKLFQRSIVQPPFNLLLVLNILWMAAYLLYYNTIVHSLLSDSYLYKNTDYQWGYYIHFAILALFIVLIKDTYSTFAARENADFIKKIMVIAISIMVVFISSSELMLIDLYTNAQRSPKDNNDSSMMIKAGFSILWGACGFIFIFIGLKYKNQMLRIMALILFAITLVKLFLYDISDLSEGGKIASFIFLGVILLVISFMYQRIRKLLLTDAAIENQENEK